MGDIISFPAKTVRDNKLIENCIKGILDKTPADEKTKQEISKRSADIFNRFQCEFSPSFELTLPASATEDDKQKLLKSIEQGIRSFEKSLHDHMNVLLLERIQTEIKLYFLENHA